MAKDTYRPTQHIRHHSQCGGHQRRPYVCGPRWGLSSGLGGPGWPHSPVHQSSGSHTRPQARTTKREGAHWRSWRQVRRSPQIGPYILLFTMLLDKENKNLSQSMGTTNTVRGLTLMQRIALCFPLAIVVLPNIGLPTMILVPLKDFYKNSWIMLQVPPTQTFCICRD